MRAIDQRSDQPLRNEEAQAKELIAIQSALRWTSQAQSALVTSLAEESCEDREELLAHFRSLDLQSARLQADLLDRSSLALATSVLKRRDLRLTALLGRQDPTVVSSLGASPFLGPSLFSELSEQQTVRTDGIHTQDNMLFLYKERMAAEKKSNFKSPPGGHKKGQRKTPHKPAPPPQPPKAAEKPFPAAAGHGQPRNDKSKPDKSHSNFVRGRGRGRGRGGRGRQ